jgi:hypothetical protein
MKKITLGVTGALAALALTFGAAAPAHAASYTRYSYCTGASSIVDVRTPSYTVIRAEAYSLRDGRYLGSRTVNGTRLNWGPGWNGGHGEDVRFYIITGVNASQITTWCGFV